ncbi:hypothetical protein M408DRAFT_332814, partial [Serendipita vermifera MAFF 305830]
MCFYLHIELVLSPRLIHLERAERLAFCLQEVHRHKSACVVDEGDPVLESLSRYDG